MQHSICVFCGARDGAKPEYMLAAKDLGQAIADNNWRLVFGAGDKGIMGAVSASAVDHGAQKMGVIPTHLLGFETNNADPRENIVTDDMHSRKKLMFVNSDAVVLLPGGAGSLDEFFEVLTWAQLGLHNRPIIVGNIAGYWTPLMALVDHVIEQGFASPSLKDYFSVVEDVPAIVDALRSALNTE